MSSVCRFWETPLFNLAVFMCELLPRGTHNNFGGDSADSTAEIVIV